MNRRSPYRILFLVLLVVIVAVVDGITSPDLGFVHLGGVPYLFLIILASVIDGGTGAVISAATIAAMFLIVPLVPQQFVVPLDPDALSLSERVGLIVGIAVTAVIVRSRSRIITRLNLAERRAAEARETAERQSREAEAMEASVRELYNRHAVESRTITSLGEQLSRFQSLRRSTVFDATLESTRLMTGAESIVLYRVEEANLVLRREVCWPDRDRARYPETVEISSSIEGWVVRTGRLFTLRYIMEDPSLAEIDQGNTVIAVPIRVRGQIWGVLSIGEMPLLAYNQTSEVSLEVIAALAAGGVEQSFGVAEPGEPSDAGAPVVQDAAQLYRDLDGMLQSASRDYGHVSLFLVELRGFQRRPLSLSEDDQARLLDVIAERLHGLTSGAARLYRYQLANQFVLLGANLGYDASPYFLLRILETIGGQAWSVGAETVLPEAIVGYASSSDGDAGEMVSRAETMLLAQTSPDNGGSQ